MAERELFARGAVPPTLAEATSENEEYRQMAHTQEEAAIVRAESQLPTRPERYLLSVIAEAVSDPRIDVEKMERLLAMHQTIVTEQRKVDFMAAMAKLTPKLPEVLRLGTSHHGKYARLEDIDRAIRPLIAGEGFSLSFDSQTIEGNVRVFCKLSHASGHEETKQIDLPVDSSGSKNGAQAVISTIAYGRRILTKMFFNLIEAGEDTDGNDPTPITENQVLNLQALIDEVKINKAKFLKHLCVEKLEGIPACNYKMAINILETKRGLIARS